MASTDKPAADPESSKEVPPSKASNKDTPPPCKAVGSLVVVDVALRFLVFAASLTSVLVMVTSKQTLYKGLLPFVSEEKGPLPFEAKFDHSPAFIYFIVALSVAGLYGILTTLASISVIWKPIFSTKFLLHFAFLDVVILGIVASATGTAGGVAYIGYKGNEHVQWHKICYIFDKYCRHIAGSLALSLFASILLVLLVWLSTFSLHKKLSK